MFSSLAEISLVREELAAAFLFVISFIAFQREGVLTQTGSHSLTGFSTNLDHNNVLFSMALRVEGVQKLDGVTLLN